MLNTKIFLTILKVSHSWRKLKSLHFIQILLTFHILYTIIYTASTVVIRRASNLSTVWTQSLWFYMTLCSKMNNSRFLISLLREKSPPPRENSTTEHIKSCHFQIVTFQAYVSSLYPLKTSEKLWFSVVFRWYRKGILAWNGLPQFYVSCFFAKPNVGKALINFVTQRSWKKSLDLGSWEWRVSVTDFAPQ